MHIMQFSPKFVEWHPNILLGQSWFIHKPGREKMCLVPYAKNKGEDQPAHPRSLISAFVVRCQDRMIPLVYISEISRF